MQTYGKQTNEYHYQPSQANTSADTWLISWTVLVPEHERPSHSTGCTQSNENRTADGSFPLSSDVVGLGFISTLFCQEWTQTLTWYAMAAGTLEFAPIVVKKQPTSRGPLPFANP